MNTRVNKSAPAAQPASSALVNPAIEPESTALVKSALDDLDISKYAGAGLETAGAESFAIPFLRVIQKSSPEVDEVHARFMRDASAGMLLNTVTKELYDGKTGALFIPCHYERKQLRWAPRGAAAQGYRGEVTETEALNLRVQGKIVDHEGRTYFTDDGRVDDKKNDRLVDTRLHFGLLLGVDGVPHQVLLALVSTQIKKSKLFNSIQKERVRNVNGAVLQEPSFLYAYRITTTPESNQHGSWYGVHFALEGKVPSVAIFQMAAAFYEALKRNEVKVDLAAAEEAGDAAAGGGGDPDKF